MIVNLSDEFDLEKIVYSGQCFRPKKLKENEYLFITGDNYVVIEQLNAGQLEISCDADTWNNVWYEYFDLSFTYKELRKSINEEDSFMIRSGIAGEGIRILRQDKWEMIISYIISQRKSIPAIRTSVEKICKLYGRVIGNIEGEEIYSFPTPEEKITRGTFASIIRNILTNNQTLNFKYTRYYNDKFTDIENL